MLFRSTSPHLVDFRERIKVNGLMIPEDAVIGFLERYNDMDFDASPSFFELTTIMAFDYFASQQVDYAVIEVGLGGRLDCTNIITPVISIITNISKDHVAQLGDTLEKIAGEKAGIIKSGIPVVIGEASGKVKDVFTAKAMEKGAPIHYAPEISHSIGNDGQFHYIDDCFGCICGELTGDCQPKNTATILTALKVLKETGCRVSSEAVRLGFSKVVELTGLRGRWSRLETSPDLICDTGHNEGGWRYLSERLKQISPRLKMVIGFVNDKDVSTILSMMPRDAHYYFTCASVPRALPSDELAAIARRHGLSGGIYHSVEEAVAAAKKDSDAADTIFVGGSTFVVADLYSGLEKSSGEIN